MKHLMNQNLHLRLFSVLLIIFLFCSCSGKKDSKTTNPELRIGEARLAVPGGNIWYKVTGSGKGMPVVLIHGGPGMSSFYLKPFEDLGNNRQVVRYDQLGGGKSDVITDTTIFTIDHFVKELDLLRTHLGIIKWHVLGHSWGTILALEYYRAYPDQVASLTFGSLCFDIPAWEQSTNHLLTTLPDSLQNAVKKAESTGNYNDPVYQEAMNQFYSLYVWRNPVQADLDSILSTLNLGISSYMWGQNDFSVTGTLNKYNATPFLPKIKVPTLFTVGEFDEIDPKIVKGLSEKVSNARFIQLSGSAHMTPWDARDENLIVVREFLNTVDSLAAKTDH